MLSDQLLVLFNVFFRKGYVMSNVLSDQLLVLFSRFNRFLNIMSNILSDQLLVLLCVRSSFKLLEVRYTVRSITSIIAR